MYSIDSGYLYTSNATKITQIPMTRYIVVIIQSRQSKIVIDQYKPLHMDIYDINKYHIHPLRVIYPSKII